MKSLIKNLPLLPKKSVNSISNDPFKTNHLLTDNSNYGKRCKLNHDAKFAIIYGTTLAVILGIAAGIINDEAPEDIPAFISKWELNSIILGGATTVALEIPLMILAYFLSRAISAYQAWKENTIPEYSHRLLP